VIQRALAQSADAVELFIQSTLSLLSAQGIVCPIVSNGGTPGLYHTDEVPAATEHRPGTYIYSDRYFVEAHAFGTWDDCADRYVALYRLLQERTPR